MWKMNNVKEFQKTFSLEVANTRKEITDSCCYELGQYKELYNNLHKSFKTKKLICLFLKTVSFLAVILFLSISYFAGVHFIIIYDFIFVPLMYGLSFIGGIILLRSIIFSEDEIFDQININKTLEGISSSVEEKIKKIIKKNISSKTREELREVAQAIEKSKTFFYQEVGKNVNVPSLSFYYDFGNFRHDRDQNMHLYFKSSFSFNGKTWHGLPSHTLITFDESLNYTFETWDKVF